MKEAEQFMHKFHVYTITRVGALAVVLLSAAKISAQAQNAPPLFNPPKSYYLALGDSVAYGFQTYKALAGLPPSAFNTGDVDVFAARLRQIRPDIQTINYGCPGESTETFVKPPCVWTDTGHQLHDAFSGSQLQGALAFLRHHPGQVSPITLTLFGNDLPILLDPCRFNNQLDPACVQAHAAGFIAGFGERLSNILEQLRSAAPDAEIILTGVPDPYINALEFADPLYQAANLMMAEVAAANRVRFADPFPIFNPQGNPAAEVQALCTLTPLCTQSDSHPSDAGYQALAHIIISVSDYPRLIR
jgi:lysophospholipase L1-like esterase